VRPGEADGEERDGAFAIATPPPAGCRADASSDTRLGDQREELSTVQAMARRAGILPDGCGRQKERAVVGLQIPRGGDAASVEFQAMPVR
jgi:hypothetical protein